MSIPLDMAGSASHEESWARFLARRQALEEQMELGVCDGCDGCGTRCTSGFQVTYPEWLAVKTFLAELPKAEAERLVSQTRTIPWPGAEETGATVTYCQFRDMEKNQCAIYPVRPTICRLFGQTSWLPCPIEAVTSYPVAAASFWNDYRTKKRKTWEEWQQEESALTRANN